MVPAADHVIAVRLPQPQGEERSFTSGFLLRRSVFDGATLTRLRQAMSRMRAEPLNLPGAADTGLPPVSRPMGPSKTSPAK